MTARRISASSIAFALALAGCSDSAILEAAGQATAGAGDESALTLRVDVFPGQDSPYKPQSRYTGTGTDLTIELASTVSVRGEVTGFEAYPYDVDGGSDTGLDAGGPPPPDVQVPGDADVPVVAYIEAIIPGRVTSAIATTKSNGEYSLAVPAGRGYQVSVVPTDPALLPFQVLDEESFSDGVTSLNVQLDYGVPVFGRVTQTDGAPLPDDAVAYLVDIPSGVRGPSVPVDARGHYMLRALDGAYNLVIEGDERATLPTLQALIMVASGDSEEPVELDVDAGTISPVRTMGAVYDDDGKTVVQATVRFTSISLDGAAGSATLSTSTDTYGVFNRDLLPGVWRVEFIPAYSSTGDISPWSTEITVAMTTHDMGDVYLPARVALSGRVDLPDGQTAAYAKVVVRESGFDGYYYSTSTDAEGNYSIDVPDTPLQVSFLPVEASAAITHLPVGTPDELPSIVRLDDGSVVAGQIVAEGAALPYVLVELRDEYDELYGSTLTDEDGRFQVQISDTIAR